MPGHSLVSGIGITADGGTRRRIVRPMRSGNPLEGAGATAGSTSADRAGKAPGPATATVPPSCRSFHPIR